MIELYFVVGLAYVLSRIIMSRHEIKVKRDRFARDFRHDFKNPRLVYWVCFVIKALFVWLTWPYYFSKRVFKNANTRRKESR